jgi:hypothetical protein
VTVAIGTLTAFTIGVRGIGSGEERAGAAPQPSRIVTTLVFPSQMLAESDSSTYPITVPYPPTEGVGTYLVPANSRLVIESAYATTTENYGADGTGRRSDLQVSLSSFYDYGGDCPFPGRQRNYGLNVSPPVVTDEGVNEQQEQTYSEVRHADLAGPIYVEGGRTVVANAQGPGGNSQVIVQVILHGHLEPAVNPNNPTPPAYCS